MTDDDGQRVMTTAHPVLLLRLAKKIDLRNNRLENGSLGFIDSL